MFSDLVVCSFPSAVGRELIIIIGLGKKPPWGGASRHRET